LQADRLPQDRQHHKDAQEARHHQHQRGQDGEQPHHQQQLERETQRCILPNTFAAERALDRGANPRHSWRRVRKFCGEKHAEARKNRQNCTKRRKTMHYSASSRARAGASPRRTKP
jgi:hypothetical protein